MLPGADLRVKSIPWARGVYHLPVAMDGVVGLDEAAGNATSCQAVADQTHAVAGWQRGWVVANERHPVAKGVVVPGVGTLLPPATALIHVAIRAHHETERQRALLLSYYSNKLLFWDPKNNDTNNSVMVGQHNICSISKLYNTTTKFPVFPQY